MQLTLQPAHRYRHVALTRTTCLQRRSYLYLIKYLALYYKTQEIYLSTLSYFFNYTLSINFLY